MGKRGPVPTPTEVLRMRGSWRGDLNKNEPRPDVCRPEPPVWLEGEALKEWNYIAPKLEIGGVMTDWDRNALAAYCKACASYVEAVKAIDSISGLGRMVVKTHNGNLVQNPLIGVRNKALENMRRLGAEFGLSPSSRARIAMSEQDKPRGNSKAKFFRAG